MNIWWLIIIPLPLLWTLPMIGMHRAHAPIWVFILMALFWSVVAGFAQPMYDWGTEMARRLGHSRLVALRERLKPKVLPPARVGLIAMAVTSLIFAIISF